MALDFRQITVNFDNTAGIIQEQPFTAVFDGRVRKAEAALKGFKIGFSGNDHEFLREEIDIDIDQISGTSVKGRVQFLLRDDTGLGNAFGGYVQLLVIADVV